MAKNRKTYEVWVKELKYEWTLVYKGLSLRTARAHMNEEICELTGDYKLYDTDTMSYRFVEQRSGLELWRVEIREAKA